MQRHRSNIRRVRSRVECRQRRDIAMELLETLEHIAAAAGITRVTGECLAVNEPFVRLIRTLDFRVFPDASDGSLLQIEKHIGEGTRSRRATFECCRGRALP